MITIAEPTQHDLDCGACLTATVAQVEDDMIAIVIEPRDAFNLVDAIRTLRLKSHDDTMALYKLADLIEEAIK